MRSKAQEPVTFRYVRGRLFDEIILDDAVSLYDGDSLVFESDLNLDTGDETLRELYVERKVGE